MARKKNMRRYEITYTFAFPPYRETKAVVYATSNKKAVEEFKARLDEELINLISISDITWMMCE